MEQEWLGEKLSVKEAEQKYSVKDKELGPDPVPFGFCHSEWLAFKEQIQESDELREFSSDDALWENLCGRAGLSIVRDGRIVDSFVTVMS